MSYRISNNNITNLDENEVFVFGSNLSGRHGKGAAKTALKFGAVYGKGIGAYGQTYAIPTKNAELIPLPLSQIRLYILDFILYALEHPRKIFLVTEIGCGYAGYKPEDIAPMFSKAILVENIYLPKTFVEILNREI